MTVGEEVGLAQSKKVQLPSFMLALQPTGRALARRMYRASKPMPKCTVAKAQVSAQRPVPVSIPRPPYVNGSPPVGHPPPQIHNAVGQERMRASCRIAADALRYAGQVLKPGMTTDELDALVHDVIVERGAYPSPLGYAGFPKAICTSINEVVCHGIPDR